METKEKIAYAKKVLKQYKSNDYLADLGIEPDLQTDGTIRNLDEFIEIKNKTKNPLTCETPIEKNCSDCAKSRCFYFRRNS